MTTSHFRVELIHCARESKIAVLAVHIVCPRAGIIFQPDRVILDDAGVALNQFVNVQNLTRGLLHFVHLMQKVPKTGLGHHFIGGEDLHTENCGVGLGLGGHMSSDDLILPQPCLLKGSTGAKIDHVRNC